MGFETDRAALNHNALKNDVLARLTDAPSAISRRADRNRVASLADMLMRQEEPDANMLEAMKYWQQPRDFKVSVAAAVRRLVRLARNLVSYEVMESSFPKDAAIERWLATMDKLITRLDRWPPVDSEISREELVLGFWEAATQMHDFLHDMSIDSPSFWRLFRKRTHA